ncbi:MAG: hypothetical protein ABMA64_29390 [Myxococcota bacterium]
MTLLCWLACAGTEPAEVEPKAHGPLDGGWYTVALPEGWRERPLLDDKQKVMFDRQFAPPQGAPEVVVLVARPRVLPGRFQDGALTPALAAAVGGPGAVFEPVTWLGGPATVVRSAGTRPDGSRAQFSMWMAVRDGHLVGVDCGGVGAAVDAAATFCPSIVESFALTGDLPDPPPLLPAEGATWERHTVGPLTLEVARGWEGLTREWFAGQVTGGFRGPAAPSGPIEVPLFTVAFVQNLQSFDQLLAGVEQGAFRMTSRGAIETPFGPAVRTELSNGLDHRSVVDLVSAGVGIELTCEVPERIADVAAGYCDHMFASLAAAKP